MEGTIWSVSIKATECSQPPTGLRIISSQKKCIVNYLASITKQTLQASPLSLNPTLLLIFAYMDSIPSSHVEELI